MNPIDKVKSKVVAGFMDRCGQLARNVTIFSNPTEEIVEAGQKNKPIKLYQRGSRMLARGGSGAKERLEQNYLFDTRRFPIFAAGEAFPVTIAAQDYLFFQNAVGQPAINNGFGTALTTMTELETNMDVAGQIAQGKNFVMHQIGVSFNADIISDDAATLMESGALRFEKQGGQYTLRHGPVRQWPGGTGVAGFAAAATTVAATTINIEAASNGEADLRVSRRLNVPRIIKEKESFAYKYVVPRTIRNTSGAAPGTDAQLTAGCLMTIWLWGAQGDDIPV